MGENRHPRLALPVALVLGAWALPLALRLALPSHHRAHRSAWLGLVLGLAYVACLFPTLGLLGGHIVMLHADRYCYLPSLLLGADAAPPALPTLHTRVSRSRMCGWNGAGGPELKGCT